MSRLGTGYSPEMEDVVPLALNLFKSPNGYKLSAMALSGENHLHIMVEWQKKIGKNGSSPGTGQCDHRIQARTISPPTPDAMLLHSC